MTPSPDILIDALRSWAGSIPQAADAPPCKRSRLLNDAAIAIECLCKEKERLEALVAEFGEVASLAAYHARQSVLSSEQAGRKTAHINAKAMNHFDPSYRKGEFA